MCSDATLLLVANDNSEMFSLGNAYEQHNPLTDQS